MKYRYFLLCKIPRSVNNTGVDPVNTIKKQVMHVFVAVLSTKEAKMIKRLLVVALLLMIACMAYGEAQGGPIANALYSNSMYGLAHPLTNEFPLPINYALSDSDVKKRQVWDAGIGAGANLLIPGLGSLIIGDPNSARIFFGSLGSMALAYIGAAWGVVSALAWNENGTRTGEMIMYSGFAFAIGFRVWGVVSPIMFVTTDRYLERVRR